MNSITDRFIHAICWSLLHSLWQGLILAVIAGLVMVLSKRAGSALRYNLLCSLLILFIASITVTFCLQFDRSLPGDPSITHVTGNIPAIQGIDPSGGQGLTARQRAISPFQTGIDSFVHYFNEHASLLVLVWFIIFLARFVKITGGLVAVQRIRYYKTSPAPAEWQQKLTDLLRRLQISQPVLLLESALIKIPVVVGFLKPTILVPMGMLVRLSPLQVESILIHELAHIRRSDYLFNLLQNMVDTFFFFNPALIWVSSLIRAERENCCDDIAIGETRSRKKFVEALISFHAYSNPSADYALSFAGKENHLVKRVRRIVYKKNHSLNPGERILLMGSLVVLSAAFMAIDHNRPVSSPTRPNLRIAALPPTSHKTKPVPTIDSTGFDPIVGRGTGLVSTQVRAALSGKAYPLPLIRHAKKDTAAPAPKGKNDQSQAFRFEDLSLDQLTECREHGVTADYIKAFEKMGYRGVGIEKFITLRDHGVSAEFIKDLNELGFTGISLDEARVLKDHGVSASFISDLQRIGYGSLTLANAMDMRDHGASAEFIEGFLKLGFKNITVDMAIRLVDHGVSSGFIESFNKRTGARLELYEYIRLRDAGIRAS